MAKVKCIVERGTLYANKDKAKCSAPGDSVTLDREEAAKLEKAGVVSMPKAQRAVPPVSTGEGDTSSDGDGDKGEGDKGEGEKGNGSGASDPGVPTGGSGGTSPNPAGGSSPALTKN